MVSLAFKKVKLVVEKHRVFPTVFVMAQQSLMWTINAWLPIGWCLRHRCRRGDPEVYILR